MLLFPGIGIVFDIDQCGGNYGYHAWRLFMKHIDPQRLAAGILLEGDTAATLNGSANEFCIGVYGADPEYIRQMFEAVDEPGLAPMHRRFIEKIALDQQPLCEYGKVDAFGRLVTESWTRSHHDRCKASGWGYAPRQVPTDLPADVRADLEELRANPLEPCQKKKSADGASGPPSSPQQPPRKKSSADGPGRSPSPKKKPSEAQFLRFTCRECGKRLKADPASSGKKAKCPKCGCQVVVPPLEDLEVDWNAIPEARARAGAAWEKPAPAATPRPAPSPVSQQAAITCDKCKKQVAASEVVTLGEWKVCPACDRALDEEIMNEFKGRMTIFRSRR